MYVFKDCECKLVDKLIITLAPTGMIPVKSQTPYVPITPEEIANDTYEAYKLGASVVHVHARDQNGKPTYEKAVFEKIFKEIKRRCPDIIICATTSGRVHPQVEHRAEVLDLYPEMATLTLGSLNFPQHSSVNPMETIKKLARLMIERNILPELEIFEPGFINTAKYLVRKNYLKKPLHFCFLPPASTTYPTSFTLCPLNPIGPPPESADFKLKLTQQPSSWAATPESA